MGCCASSDAQSDNDTAAGGDGARAVNIAGGRAATGSHPRRRRRSVGLESRDGAQRDSDPDDNGSEAQRRRGGVMDDDDRHAQEEADHMLAQLLFQEQLMMLERRRAMRQQRGGGGAAARIDEDLGIANPRSPVLPGVSAAEFPSIGRVMRYEVLLKKSTSKADVHGEFEPPTRDDSSTFFATEVTECPLCMEDLAVGCELRVLFCTHVFHRGCIDDWLHRKRVCPMCQQDVTLMIPRTIRGDPGSAAVLTSSSQLAGRRGGAGAGLPQAQSVESMNHDAAVADGAELPVVVGTAVAAAAVAGEPNDALDGSAIAVDMDAAAHEGGGDNDSPTVFVGTEVPAFSTEDIGAAAAMAAIDVHDVNVDETPARRGSRRSSGALEPSGVALDGPAAHTDSNEAGAEAVMLRSSDAASAELPRRVTTSLAAEEDDEPAPSRDFDQAELRSPSAVTAAARHAAQRQPEWSDSPPVGSAAGPPAALYDRRRYAVATSIVSVSQIVLLPNAIASPMVDPPPRDVSQSESSSGSTRPQPRREDAQNERRGSAERVAVAEPAPAAAAASNFSDALTPQQQHPRSRLHNPFADAPASSIASPAIAHPDEPAAPYPYVAEELADQRGDFDVDDDEDDVVGMLP